MKRLIILISVVILTAAFNLLARGYGDYSGHNTHNQDALAQNDNQDNWQGMGKSTNYKPVVINMKQASSGGQNRNFPSQQGQQRVGRVSEKQQTNNEPSYGRLQWTTSKSARQSAQKNYQTHQGKAKNIAGQNLVVNALSITGSYSAGVAHQRPNDKNIVQQQLKKLGVKSEPGYITNREDVVYTDRAHSMIAYPKTGFDNHPITAMSFSPRQLNDKAVRTQMSLVVSASWNSKIWQFDRNETMANHYYWHRDRNFNYCHYMDDWGYSWYGWYLGNRCFWTRHFNSRWWWYDTNFDRWCFWNGGFWWWQDPYHFGDLYCYNGAAYVAVNSAADNVNVAVPDNKDMRTYTSPDKTRIVKVVTDTQDAFLYDASNHPAFDPVYLASGVQDVLFSSVKNGKPLEIILKLNDGSFDMFDGDGNTYHPSASESSR